MTAEEVYIDVANQVFSKGSYLGGVALAIDGYPFDWYFPSIFFYIYSTLCVDILNSRFCAPAGNATKYGILASIRYSIADENILWGFLLLFLFLLPSTADKTHAQG